MSRTWNEILVPINGTFTVNDTTAKEIDFYAIKIDADTVISELLNEKGVDVKDDYISTPASAVKAGAMITLKDQGKKFTSITLTSGSVTLVL
jgi:hypothetical protein